MKYILTTLICLCSLPAFAAVAEAPSGAFSFTVDVVIDGDGPTVWDAATGDITGWWDHSMSETPHAMYVEAKPGGAFMEIFDANGDGVRHAVVTYVKQGETLRYEGPLGLAGHALHMVTTWSFAAEGGRTRVTVEVHAAGEVHGGWPEVIEKTWDHFLGQLKTYVEEAG